MLAVQGCNVDVPASFALKQSLSIVNEVRQLVVVGNSGSVAVVHIQ